MPTKARKLGGNEKKKAIEPVGPFAPPRPSEVEASRPEPMAVANDKQTPHDSFRPTSAPMSDTLRHPDEDEAGGRPIHRNERAVRELAETDEDDAA